jgi:hypothetical protein
MEWIWRLFRHASLPGWFASHRMRTASTSPAQVHQDKRESCVHSFTMGGRSLQCCPQLAAVCLTLRRPPQHLSHPYQDQSSQARATVFRVGYWRRR